MSHTDFLAHTSSEVSPSQADMDLELQTQQSHAATMAITRTFLVKCPQRRLWRWIYVIFKARQMFFKVGAVAKGKASSTSSSALPYTTTTLSESEQRSIETSTPILAQVSQEDTTLVDIVVEEPETSRTINDSSHATIRNQYDTIAEKVKQKAKDLKTLHESGGVEAISELLKTNLATGLQGDEDELRWRRAPETVPRQSAATEASRRGFFWFLFRRCNDWTIILLVIAAALYIGFGIKMEGPKTGWYTGTVVLAAAIVLVLAPTIHDLWLKHSARKRRLLALRAGEQKKVHVLRGGSLEEVSLSSVVLGDIVSLNKGSLVPGDGLFLGGKSLVVNDGLEITIDRESPFLYYGWTVSHGSGRMLVTTVGTNTLLGEPMSKLTKSGEARSESDDTRVRLPSQLDKLRKVTHILSLAVTIPIIAVLSLGLTLGGPSHAVKPSFPDIEGKPAASKQFMDIMQRLVMEMAEIGSLKAPLAILMLGLLEGMPFLITLAAIYWRRKMLSGKASVSGLLDCVKMGSAATVVTDKTLLNSTDVVVCVVGCDDNAIEAGNTNVSSGTVREALCNGISTPLVLPSSHAGCATVEDPLLPWAASNLDMKLDILMNSRTVMKTKRLSSDEEGSGVLMKKRKIDDCGREEEAVYVHWKGPATTILGKSSSYYDKNGEEQALDEDKRNSFGTKIEQIRHEGLEAVGFAYKKISSPSPTLEENGLILTAVLGLKNHTCSEKTRVELKTLQDAGVKIVLVSEDDVSELKETATACGILPRDGLVISGQDFQEFDDQLKMEKVDKICVMGNASPSDRLLLMQWRKKKEKDKLVVALGTRTSEAPALKEADLGVAMGDWSSDTVKESSDIIIHDGTLSSLLDIIRCGRCTYHNIQKYIQVELVTNISGTLFASVTTMRFGWTPITGFQLIWATFMMTVVGGPALLLEPPRDELLCKPPVEQSAPLISKPMWRNIVVQILYQTAILTAFQYKGKGLAILDITKAVSKSMIFNTFVLCQLFNLVNSREIEKMNIFTGIRRNTWLFASVTLVVTLQVIFIEEAHILVDNARLDFKQWGVCVLIGLCSCPVDAAAKFTSKFVKNRKLASSNGATTMVHSASSDSVENLELPLMRTSNSFSLPSQE